MLLYQVVRQVVDKSATITFRENTQDDPHKRKPDISNAKALLGWEPKISLREGLPLMVEDFRRRVFNDNSADGDDAGHSADKDDGAVDDKSASEE